MYLKQKQMKSFISTLPQYTMDTKRGIVVTCSRWTPPSNTCDLLIGQSHDKFKKLISTLPEYLWPSDLAGW